MSKILVHIGLPKAGSKQLQRLFGLNADTLGKHSISYLRPKLKAAIHPHFQAYRRANTSHIEQDIEPGRWFRTLPRTYFASQPPHRHALISEEALSKLFSHPRELFLFDTFLAEFYEEKTYLAVIREINGHTTSRISQAIQGTYRVNYRGCKRMLRDFSLDQMFSGALNIDINLTVASFKRLITNSDSASYTAHTIERVFATPPLKLENIDGVTNQSLGAEGTAIRIAHNNIVRMLLGEQNVIRWKIDIRKYAKRLDKNIREQFPRQRKFCPFTEQDQLKFNSQQRGSSHQFIKQFPGPWVDDVFNPIVRERSVSLLSEFTPSDLAAAIDLLGTHIDSLLNNLVVHRSELTHTHIANAVRYFLKNEKQLLF